MSMTHTLFAIALVVALLTPASSFAGSLTASQAKYHIGEYHTVCGYVAEVKHLRKRVVMNMEQRYPNEDIYGLVWNDKVNFIQSSIGLLDNLAGQRICITGFIEEYKGHANIIISSPSELKVVK